MFGQEASDAMEFLYQGERVYNIALGRETKWVEGGCRPPMPAAYSRALYALFWCCSSPSTS